VLVLVVGSLAWFAPRVFGQGSGEAAHVMTTVRFEVAENGNRFAPDEAPVFEDDGYPAYGGAFITEGYLYPEGTLANATHGGVMPDGTPEFPDLVMGSWTCWGYHVGDGAHTETGPWVATTQIFDFGDKPGDETIISTGFEYPDMNAPFTRAVTGGSGEYRSARGEQEQTFIGWNDSVGVMLEVAFTVDTIQDTFMPLLGTGE
jgi:hypothetical protein